MIPSRTVSATNCPALPRVMWPKYCSFSFATLPINHVKGRGIVREGEIRGNIVPGGNVRTPIRHIYVLATSQVNRLTVTLLPNRKSHLTEGVETTRANLHQNRFIHF